MRKSPYSPIRAIVVPLLVASFLPGLAFAGTRSVDDELRTLLAPAVESGVQTPSPRAALARAYASRGFAPLWQKPARRQQLLVELEALVNDGLDPAAYGTERLRHPLPDTASPLQRAQDDLSVSEACTRALSHLQQGRLSPERAGSYWQSSALAPLTQPPPAQALAAMGDGDLGQMFDRFRPPTPLYRALRKAMTEALHSGDANDGPAIPAGPTLRPGMSGPRVDALRARLIASGYLPNVASAGQDMDDVVSEAVGRFQREEGLESDGIVGPLTLTSLNRSPAERKALLRINLERARWIAPHQVGDYVFVDVAAYRLTFYRNSSPAWSTRTQVGQPARETPLLFSSITHFTVNPTWTVPPTILKKDIIPKASADPEYLASRNIHVINADGDEVDPATIDWTRTGGLTLRQDAGDDAALGKVAIRFSNPHAVYLHDTPHQRQFKRTQRAFSSGCVRVENAVDLVRLLVDASGGDSHLARFEAALASGRTGNLSLARPIPLVIAYLTAAPDDNGRITFRPDIYGRDPELIHALGADAR
nr:L,D-transpeptidase family protein [Azoarcus sp. L1K30]